MTESKLHIFPAGRVNPRIRLAQLTEHVDDMHCIYAVVGWKDKEGGLTWSTVHSSMTLAELGLAHGLVQIDFIAECKERFDPDLDAIGVNDDEPPGAA